MSEKRDRDFLLDLREAARRISTYARGMTYEEFLRDTRTQDAIVRNLEIMGEAVKNLSAELRVRYPAMPWREMAGLRDRLIHHYSGVNLDIVWQIASVDLESTVGQLETIIEATYDNP